MPETLHQKGASGLIAEYQCAVTLHTLLVRSGFHCVNDLESLERDLTEAISRVGNELDSFSLEHSKAQGVALAEYIKVYISADPQRLGVVLGLNDVRRSDIGIRTVGRSTNSGTSADLEVTFHVDDATAHLPISLKAYRSAVSSLGSKGAKASLGRAFLNQPKLTDPAFIQAFGEDAAAFVQLLADFKTAGKEFYDSREGRDFVVQYRLRKNDSLAKVNNPFRRKEVGDYFIKTRGFRPEHRFAELYASMFNAGMTQLLEDGTTEEWVAFIEQIRFLIGMDGDVLTLTSMGAVGGEVRVSNSLDDGVYADLRKVLVKGCLVQVVFHPGSSVMRVTVTHGVTTVSCLSLTIWKDSTIQFKIDSRVRS